MLLVHAGDDGFALAVFAEVREQQQQPGQAFLARVEDLVHEIRFVADDALQEVRDEHFGQRRLVVEHLGHRRLLDLHQRARVGGDRREHPRRLAGEAAFAEKLRDTQRRDNRFLAFTRRHAELHLAAHDKVERVGRRALLEHRLMRGVFDRDLPLGDAREQHFPPDQIRSPALSGRGRRAPS